MKKYYLVIILLLLLIIAIVLVILIQQNDKNILESLNNTTINNRNSNNESYGNMPNPASVNCRDKGYQSEIITSADGSQYGICIFPDGSQCDDWAFFQGKCKIGQNKVGQAGTGSGCVKAGCSGTLCVEKGHENDIITTCEFLPAYECYNLTTCQRLPDNTCGWVQTDEYKECVKDKSNY